MEPAGTTRATGRADPPGPPPPREGGRGCPLPAEWAHSPLTVVMPTYNEAQTLPRAVAGLLALELPGLRLLVVDDASPDGTGDLAERLARRHATGSGPWITVLHRRAKEGLGRAYAAGMSHALAEGAGYVLQMDADGSHPAAAVPELLGVARATGAGLVVGSRYVAGGALSARWGRHRRLLSGWANAYAGTILRSRIRDLTGGFNLWRADTLRAVDPAGAASAGYGFQLELKYRAQRLGCRPVEVPIRFAERHAGASKMTAAVQWEAALLPWRLRLAQPPAPPAAPRPATGPAASPESSSASPESPSASAVRS